MRVNELHTAYDAVCHIAVLLFALYRLELSAAALEAEILARTTATQAAAAATAASNELRAQFDESTATATATTTALNTELATVKKANARLRKR
jgi:hypothetical protein